MTTIEASRIHQGQTTTPDSIAHGAHIDCQLDATEVIGVCGVTLQWDDRQDGTTELCVVCRDLLTCPVCGAPLRMPA